MSQFSVTQNITWINESDQEAYKLYLAGSDLIIFCFVGKTGQGDVRGLTEVLADYMSL